jgi:hypothetical protein
MKSARALPLDLSPIARFASVWTKDLGLWERPPRTPHDRVCGDWNRVVRGHMPIG